MRYACALTLAACCMLAVSACSATSSTSPAAGATSPAAPGGLHTFHDPGHVTYSMHPAGCHARGGGRLPDPTCTPGVVDPAVTQDNIEATICRRGGYTDSVRPPVSETDKAKRQQYAAYGIRKGTRSELDHLVPLSLGGANDITNLWPEVGAIPNPKDDVENDLHRAVCSGRVKLAAAQQAIAADWTTAEKSLGL